MRTLHRHHRLRWPVQRDYRRGLAPKEIQQNFTRRPAEPSHRLTWPNPHALAGARPFQLKPASAQPPAQKPPAAPHVSPQRGIHRHRKTARPLAIRSSNVLVVHEELVEIRHRAHPLEAEESDRRPGPNLLDEPRKVRPPRQSRPAPLGEPREGPGQNEAWPGDRIVFSLHQMRGQIVSGPAVEQGGSRRTEPKQQIAQLAALQRVQPNISHAGTVYGPCTPSSTRSTSLRTWSGIMLAATTSRANRSQNSRRLSPVSCERHFNALNASAAEN